MSKSPGNIALGAVRNTGLGVAIGVSKSPGDVALGAVKNTGRVDGTGPRRDESSGYHTFYIRLECVNCNYDRTTLVVDITQAPECVDTKTVTLCPCDNTL